MSEIVETVAKALYERNPRYDQETDIDGRPTSAPYRIGWDELAEYNDGYREEILEDARAALAAILPAELRELSEKGSGGPWSYRSQKYDDWGTVRAADGLICQARDPKTWANERILSEHRQAGTDPWEANARLVAEGVNLIRNIEEVVNCGQ